ncbi:MAG: extracellular solute-binding protein [Nitratireductor sp.]|nr:extracellular solute-binding protein [Nitratireductor sp.]
MKRILIAAAAIALAPLAAHAEGKLNIFNWGEYTNPELLKRFSETYDVEVAIDTYDSNETMLAKVQAGASGYDIVVPSDYMVAIMIEEGLLAQVEPNTMENFKNVKEGLVDLYFDPGRHYTVPWQVGNTGFAVNSKAYDGNINTWSILFDTPEALKGRINVLDDMTAVINAAARYLNIPRCTSDREQLRQISDLLVAAKPNWRSFSYDGLTLLSTGSVDVSMLWNGATYKARTEDVDSLVYAYPAEGLEGFVDNVAILKDAQNVDNAKLFMNFIMAPENAALISEFAKYESGIKGVDAYLPADFAAAPELNTPAGVTPEFVPPCSQEVTAMYNKIWTNLRR